MYLRINRSSPAFAFDPPALNSRHPLVLLAFSRTKDQNAPSHPSPLGSISHASNGLNLASMSLLLGSALNPLSFKAPRSSESLNTVTTNATLDFPGGIGASNPLSTVRLVPVGFTVAAELPCRSSTKPKMFAASTGRRSALSAVASKRRQTVLFLFGTYWLGGHGAGSYVISESVISPLMRARGRTMRARERGDDGGESRVSLHRRGVRRLVA